MCPVTNIYHVACYRLACLLGLVLSSREADEQLMVGHVLAGGVTDSLSGYVAAHAETLGDGLDLLIDLVGALGAMERHGIVYNYGTVFICNCRWRSSGKSKQGGVPQRCRTGWSPVWLAIVKYPHPISSTCRCRSTAAAN